MNQIKSVKLLFMAQALSKFNPVYLNLWFSYPINKNTTKNAPNIILYVAVWSLCFSYLC